MNELFEKEKLKIEDMIYDIHGKQVILDSDLAKLYGVETKRINEAVKNNIDKFPERFSWILSEVDYKNLRSKFSTSSLKNNYGGRRYNPRVFTEQGVAMLATILKSKIAIEVSIQIMDAFVLMRKCFSSGHYERRIENLETKVIEHDRKFEEVLDKLDTTVNNHIFFEGQIYDSYSLLLDILSGAKESIILIDNYVDKKFLDIISYIKVQVTIITSNKCNLTDIDIDKYNTEYHNLEIKYNSSFHDRFMIIDNNVLYHCGASFKDLGKKCFAITKVEEQTILENLMKKL